jgi:hypothetical protein
MSAPVTSLSLLLALTWSKWPCVLMIYFTVNADSASVIRIRSASSPGSMTAAVFVSSQPKIKQLAMMGPTVNPFTINASSCM